MGLAPRQVQLLACGCQGYCCSAFRRRGAADCGFYPRLVSAETACSDQEGVVGKQTKPAEDGCMKSAAGMCRHAAPRAAWERQARPGFKGFLTAMAMTSASQS